MSMTGSWRAGSNGTPPCYPKSTKAIPPTLPVLSLPIISARRKRAPRPTTRRRSKSPSRLRQNPFQELKSAHRGRTLLTPASCFSTAVEFVITQRVGSERPLNQPTGRAAGSPDPPTPAASDSESTALPRSFRLDKLTVSIAPQPPQLLGSRCDPARRRIQNSLPHLQPGCAVPSARRRRTRTSHPGLPRSVP